MSVVCYQRGCDLSALKKAPDNKLCPVCGQPLLSAASQAAPAPTWDGNPDTAADTAADAGAPVWP